MSSQQILQHQNHEASKGNFVADNTVTSSHRELIAAPSFLCHAPPTVGSWVDSRMLVEEHFPASSRRGHLQDR